MRSGHYFSHMYANKLSNTICLLRLIHLAFANLSHITYVYFNKMQQCDVECIIATLSCNESVNVECIMLTLSLTLTNVRMYNVH